MLSFDLFLYMSYLSYTRQRIPKVQLNIDNPEKLATQGTQDEDKQNNNTTQYVLDINAFDFNMLWVSVNQSLRRLIIKQTQIIGALTSHQYTVLHNNNYQIQTEDLSHILCFIKQKYGNFMPRDK